MSHHFSLRAQIAGLAVLLAAIPASAQSLNLANYTVSGTYALDILNGTSGGISGLEGSGITYARDRGSLFFVGDEGTGVIEISKTGQTLGNSTFDWTGTGSTKHDTEGITYMGGGVLVLGEERLQDAYKFNYVAGSSVPLKNNFVSLSNTAVGNNGMEGISYDPRGAGSFVAIRQQSPEGIFAGTLTFGPATGAPPSTSGDGSSPPGGGVSTFDTTTNLFDPALLGVSTLSDVQTLASVDRFVGTSAADNLLILSLGSKKLLEVTRTGTILSSFDLANVLPHNAIEGVTVDEQGTIYLVAEQVQDGSGTDPNPPSELVVLRAVPEPGSAACLLTGLGALGFIRRRSRTSGSR